MSHHILQDSLSGGLSRIPCISMSKNPAASLTQAAWAYTIINYL